MCYTSRDDMPRQRKLAFARPTPIQLPLFAETASLVLIRPTLNEWRYYRMEIWPDLFGWSGHGAASARRDAAVSTSIPIQALPSTHWPPCSGPSAAATTRTVSGEGVTAAAGTARKVEGDVAARRHMSRLV
jgi:hypothetical protein